MLSTNYLYAQRPKRSALEFISTLSPEQGHLILHGLSLKKPHQPILREYASPWNIFRSLFGLENNKVLKKRYEDQEREYQKDVTKYEASVSEFNSIRKRASNDHKYFMRCLGIKQLTKPEIIEKWEKGHISNAEEQLFQMLSKRASVSWHIYHQVNVNGLFNPVDIVALSPQFEIYAIELDGPHHIMRRQRYGDNKRDALLLDRGFSIIRVGYDKYLSGCSQTVHEIILILNGSVQPEYNSRPLVYTEIEDEIDFYPTRIEKKLSSKSLNIEVITERYCYIYCQTTGIDCDSQIVDFCLLMDKGRAQKQYYSRIKPTCSISKRASALHGINKRDLKDCPSLRGYLEQFGLKQILEDTHALLVTYDWEFMGRVIKNSAPRYLNQKKMNLYSVLRTARLKYGLESNSTIADALASMGIAANQYQRYNSKDYARLVREMYIRLTDGTML